MTLPKLPDDIAALKTLVMDNYQRAEQEEFRATEHLEKYKAEHQRAELLQFKLDNLIRLHYGASSEKLKEPAGQQLLFELPARPEMPDPEPIIDTIAVDAPSKKHGGGRKPLPKDLPRERREYTLSEAERKCSCCGDTMQPFGEESSEQLEYIPATLEHISLDGVIQHEDGDGFAHGNWTAPYRTPAGLAAVLEAQGSVFDLLLGRRTYDSWAGYWPKAGNSPIANGLNTATKYVATHRPDSLEWDPVSDLGADIIAGIRGIKLTDGPDLIVCGSSTLTSLLARPGIGR